MRPSVTSAILILALFSCPLWCSWASAHGFSCCGNRAETDQLRTAEATDCCCCHQPDASLLTDCEAPSNGEKPAGESHCQGICGGAILDGDADIPLPLLLAFDLDLMVDTLALVSANVPASLAWQDSPASFRTTETLRALHVLILC